MQHLKCYAKVLDNCATKISKEHYISDNILETYTKIFVEGIDVRRLDDGSTPRGSLAPKILCERHNSNLTSLDEESGKLFKVFRKIESFEQCPNQFSIDGRKIERWFLKCLLGLSASKSLKGSKISESRFAALVRILFVKEPWPDQHGLYFGLLDEKSYYAAHEIGMTPKCGPNGEVLAANFTFGGLYFVLALGKPSDMNIVYRPRYLRFVQGNGAKIVEFNWFNKKYNQYVDLKSVGKYKGDPPERNF